MKRLFFLICVMSACALCVCFPAAPQKTACAEAPQETYAVAATNGVWFYSEALSEKGLFILPESYYVCVLDDGDPFCKVQYLNLTGFCKKSDLLFVDFVPVRPFLNYEYTLSYTMENGSAVGNGSLSSIERKVSFLGTFPHGTETYYYVSAGDIYDYVPKTQEIVYEKNTDYLTPASADANAGNASAAGKGLSGVEIAVICVACAACIAVAFFVLRGKKPPVPRSEEQVDF